MSYCISHTSILIRGVVTDRELLFEHARFFTVGASETKTVDVLEVLTPLDFDSSLFKVRVAVAIKNFLYESKP